LGLRSAWVKVGEAKMAMMGVFILMIGIIGVVAGVIILAAFGIGAIILGFGGVISSSFIKNSIVKRLLIISFFIVIVVGLVCALPIILPIMQIYIELTAFLIAVAFGIALIALGISGVRISRSLENIMAKIIFRIVFFSSVVAGLLLSFPFAIYYISQ
jgi:hypothetical protein